MSLIFVKHLLTASLLMWPSYFYGQTDKNDIFSDDKKRDRSSVNKDKDTTSLQKSDTAIYKKIKRFAYKRKVTRMIYNEIFTEPVPGGTPKISKSSRQKQKDPNAVYTGRVIRNIQIEVLDPFGNSVNDTTTKVIYGLQRFGNKIHMKTRRQIIRNLLLFKKHDKVDMLEISESERILRTAGYITDARIHILPLHDSGDSVDVKVLVHDRWSWDLAAAIDDASTSLSLRNINVLGLGQQFEQRGAYYFWSQGYNLRSRHYINNIGHTYISSNILYINTQDISRVGISFDRPFYSPLAKWAGGAQATKTWGVYRYLTPDSVQQSHPLDYLNTDIWIAKSFSPGRGNSINRRSQNIGVAFRYSNTFYQKKPSYEIDTARTMQNNSLYLGSLSYSVRKFYKDKYIYRFGYNEDIPEGWLVQWLYGIQQTDVHGLRYYTGAEASRGMHFKKVGYFSISVGYGNFFNKSIRNSSSMTAGLFYFSNLLKSGRWFFRQFFNYKIVYGFNKTPGQYITLRFDEMYGFNSGLKLKGSAKMITNFETVIYTPFNVIGFRFAPVISIGLGMLNNENGKFKNAQIYQAYALGLLIRNENLLTSSFEISVGAYPILVNDVTNHFEYNPITSFTLRLSGFAVTKPTPVAYH